MALNYYKKLQKGLLTNEEVSILLVLDSAINFKKPIFSYKKIQKNNFNLMGKSYTKIKPFTFFQVVFLISILQNKEKCKRLLQEIKNKVNLKDFLNEENIENSFEDLCSFIEYSVEEYRNRLQRLILTILQWTTIFLLTYGIYRWL